MRLQIESRLLATQTPKSAPYSEIRCAFLHLIRLQTRYRIEIVTQKAWSRERQRSCAYSSSPPSRGPGLGLGRGVSALSCAPFEFGCEVWEVADTSSPMEAACAFDPESQNIAPATPTIKKIRRVMKITSCRLVPGRLAFKTAISLSSSTQNRKMSLCAAGDTICRRAGYLLIRRPIEPR